ncbi:hypothetical protein ES705_10137 [subsurface metagenome]
MNLTPRDLDMPRKVRAWRDGQYEAIEAVSKSEQSVFLLDAPTGVGKSIIAIAWTQRERLANVPDYNRYVSYRFLSCL